MDAPKQDAIRVTSATLTPINAKKTLKRTMDAPKQDAIRVTSATLTPINAKKTLKRTMDAPKRDAMQGMSVTLTPINVSLYRPKGAPKRGVTLDIRATQRPTAASKTQAQLQNQKLFRAAN